MIVKMTIEPLSFCFCFFAHEVFSFWFLSATLNIYMLKGCVAICKKLIGNHISVRVSQVKWAPDWF